MMRRLLPLPAALALALVAGCPGAGGGPEIVSFTAQPTTLQGSGSSTLRWETVGADEVVITDGDGQALDLTGQSAEGGEVVVDFDAAGEYDFLLTATGASKYAPTARSVTVTVEALPLPVIDSFVASADTVVEGSVVTLSWETTIATRISLADAAGNVVLESNVALDGSEVVRPQATTTYVLTAIGPGGSVTAEVTVTTVPPVVVGDFTATPDTDVVPGSDVTLAWTTTGADSLTIVDGAGATVLNTDTDLDGSLVVNPAATETYTLTAVNAADSDSGSVTVTVVPVVLIDSFTASPAIDVVAGTDVVLAWTTTGADTVTITDDASNTVLSSTTELDGSTTVNPAADVTYTLTASGIAGTVTESVTVTVLPVPVIDTFTVTPTTPVNAGDTVTFDWTTSNATSVRLTDASGTVVVDTTVDLDGSATHAPTTTTEYTLSAMGPGGMATARLTVEVLMSILSFDASLPAVAPSGTVDLSWTTVGGTSAEITDDGGAAVCTSTTPDADGCTVTLPATVGSYVYTLALSNDVPVTETATVTVVVSDGPLIQSFTADAAILTVGGTVTFDWVALDDGTGATPTMSLVDDQSGTYDVSAAGVNPGSYATPLSSTGTYVFTLTASTGNGPDATAMVTVVVVDAPVIASFASNREVLDTATGPMTANLSWTTTGGTTATLWELDAAGTPTTVVYSTTDPTEVAAHVEGVSPTSSTTYRLELANDAGDTDVRDVFIAVDEPWVLSLDASAAQVAAGASVDVSWTTNSRTTAVLVTPTPPPSATPVSGGFTDISATGTQIQTADLYTSDFTGDVWDEGVTLVAFPGGFVFPYYGTDRTQVVITANGYLTFDAAVTDPRTGHPAMPSPNAPNGGIIAPFLDDLDGNFDGSVAAGSLYWELVSGAGGDAFVVQWTNWQIYDFGGQTDDLNFQVWLWADGTIDFHYGTMSSPTQADADGASATIGVENDGGTEGVGISFDTAIAGGLSGQGWTIGGPSVNGAFTDTPADTADYEVCATDGTLVNCKTVSVVVVNAGDVMISELMVDPFVVTDALGEWVEVFNTSADPIDLDGWTLNAGAAGSHVVTGPLMVPPGGSRVVGVNADPSTNGGAPVDHAWGGSIGDLDPASGSFALDYGVLQVDQVTWDGTWGIVAGVSLQADSAAGLGGDPAANDVSAAWCASGSGYGDGDLGSPGAANNAC